MPLEWDFESKGTLECIYSWDVEDPKGTRQLVFEIDKGKKEVRFLPRDNFPVKRVLFDGFGTVPPELNRAGYIKTGGVQYYLGNKLQEISVTQLTVSRTADKKLQKKGSAYHLTLPYGTFLDIVERFKRITATAQAGRRLEMDSVFHQMFPRKCRAPSISSRHRAATLISSLDETVIKELDGGEVDRVLDFTRAVLEKKYTKSNKRHELFGAAKLKVDDVALTEVIGQFEELLKKKNSESKWGAFLRKNLFLVESRYIHVIDQLNVVLGGTRKVDFGLVDTAGFLDLFEIKVPHTKLLGSKPDRGNYYWHGEAVKALVQAEKYLYNADGKRDALAKDITREKKIAVKVVRPRAVVVLGDSSQLDTAEKAEDFRVLRRSLKNIEVVLYDELLDRLKNQKSKIYLD
jgi:hypothetical protein